MNTLLKYITLSILIISSILLIQCGSNTKSNGEETVGQGPESGGLRSLSISPELVQKWNLKFAFPEQREYVEKITLNGVLKGNNETTFLITPRVCGIVSEMKKDVGDLVEKGDVLCVLNSSELLDIKTKYIKALGDFKMKKENFERGKNLIKIKGLEQKELTSRETDYKSAMADLFSLESELISVGYDKISLQKIKEALQQDDTSKISIFLTPDYKILSPIKGKIISRDLNLGERVDENKNIYEVSNTSKLLVILDANEKDLENIEKNKELIVTTDVYRGEIFKGYVQVIMEKIDPVLRTIKVRGIINNEEGRLKPEMFVKGMLEKRLKESRVGIGANALVKISGIDGVFVKEGDKFNFKPVEILAIDSVGNAFVNGLSTKDNVVVEGAFYLKSEFMVQDEEGE